MIMDIVVMTVSNDSGQFDPNESYYGTIMPTATDKFKVYAALSDHKAKEVLVTMPVGGPEAGLFRYPRVGENILVAIDDNSDNYLVGYLPNTSNQDFTTDDVQNNYGEVLRYKQTTLKEPGDADMKYSEFGLYKDRSEFKKDASDTRNYADVDAESDFPLVDRINIQSAGDMYTRADNYHVTDTRRIRMTASDLNKKNNIAEEAPGPGDVNILAGRRMSIEAEDEIRLQVGRSVITITDAAIIVKSYTSPDNSDESINVSNPWDAMISLSPLTGVRLSGTRVSGAGYFGVSLSDAAGDGLKGSMGITRLTGKDIAMLSPSTLAFSLGAATAVGQDVVNILRSLVDNTDKHKINKSLGMAIPILISEMQNGNRFFSTEEKDVMSWVILISGLINDISNVVFFALTEVYMNNTEKNEKAVKDLLIATIATEVSAQVGVLAAVLAASAFSPEYMLGESIISCSAGGKINLKAPEVDTVALEQIKLQAPQAVGRSLLWSRRPG
jgi:hypothetical protein